MTVHDGVRPSGVVGRACSAAALSPEWRRAAYRKLELLTRGCRVSLSAQPALANAKPGIRTRSGVSGGLDLHLGDDVFVNCDVSESRCAESPYELRGTDRGLCMSGFDAPLPVEVVEEPAYYRKRTSAGTPMVQVGQLCSPDRICIGISRACAFWRRDLRCKYCSIGANQRAEAREKSIQDIAETVEVAMQDPRRPARHVLIGGGTPPGEDRGAEFAAAACIAIKARCDVSVYVMIVPPARLAYLDMLKDAGVDELGLNVEFFSEEALREYAPGKHRLVGADMYYEALAHGLSLFGRFNTRSIAIVGIERAEYTLAGVQRLVDMGVMPILSPFRSLDGSDLAGRQGFASNEYIAIMEAAMDMCLSKGLALGPTCVMCQNNVLALPNHKIYRHY